MTLEARPSPCGTCPYRRNAPSGLWHELEYAKLEEYDRDTAEQPSSRFMCHSGDGHKLLCSGWVAVHGEELLALRLGVVMGRVSSTIFSYTTRVRLWASGHEAAAWGRRDLAAPDERAQRAMNKVTVIHERRERDR